jgi:hypothetical protein
MLTGSTSTTSFTYSASPGLFKASKYVANSVKVTGTGWLYKRSMWLKQWRKRYLKIDGNKLLVSNDETSEPSHIIDLSVYDCVRSSDETTKKPHCFQISGRYSTKYTFQGSCFEETEEWMEVIGKIIDKYSSERKIIRNVINKSFIVLDDLKIYRIDDSNKKQFLALLSRPSQTNSNSNSPTVSRKPSLRDSYQSSSLPTVAGSTGSAAFPPIPTSTPSVATIPLPKYIPVEIPILTTEQKKCLLLPSYRNKPFEIRDSSSNKPLILIRNDNNEVMFLPAW